MLSGMTCWTRWQVSFHCKSLEGNKGLKRAREIFKYMMMFELEICLSVNWIYFSGKKKKREERKEKVRKNEEDIFLTSWLKRESINSARVQTIWKGSGRRISGSTFSQTPKGSLSMKKIDRGKRKDEEAKTSLRNTTFKYVKSRINLFSGYACVQPKCYLAYEVLPSKCTQPLLAILGVSPTEEARARHACLHSRALLASCRTKIVFLPLAHPQGYSSCICEDI